MSDKDDEPRWIFIKGSVDKLSARLKEDSDDNLKTKKQLPKTERESQNEK